MASRSSRKSNSSASKQKPTFRRSSGGASARTSSTKATPVAPAARVRTAPVRTYVAPTKKAASDLVSSSRRVQKKNVARAGAPHRRSAAPTVSARSAGAAAARSSRKVAAPSQAAGRTQVLPAMNQKAAKQKPTKLKPAKQKRAVTRPAAAAQPSLKKVPAAKQGGLKLPVSLGAKRLAGNTARGVERPRSGAAPSLSFLHIAVAAVLAGIVVIGIGAAILVNSGFFAITEVVVNGSAHVPQTTASQLVDVPEGATLFNVNDSEVTEALEQNPWVESVHVERRFPHTLVITPQERTVAAIAYIVSDDVAWAISSEKTWIAPLSLSVAADDASSQADDAAADAAEGADADAADDAADGTDQADTASSSQDLTGLDAAIALARASNAVLLTDVGTDVDPSSGKEVTSEVVLAGLAYAMGFSPEFRAQIKDISIPSVEAISANLENGVEVSLGKPEDIQQKEQVVKRLLEQEQGVTYINVRVADAYSFRSVPVS